MLNFYQQTRGRFNRISLVETLPNPYNYHKTLYTEYLFLQMFKPSKGNLLFIYVTCNNSKYGIVRMKSTKKRNCQSLKVERHTCNMQVINDCHSGLICISAASNTDHSWNPFLPRCTNATTLSTRTKTQICKSKSTLPFSLSTIPHTPLTKPYICKKCVLSDTVGLISYRRRRRRTATEGFGGMSDASASS